MEINENLTMYQAVKESARKNPLAIAIYYQNTKITFRRFIRLVDNMADVLTYKFNIQKGDTVLVAQPNIPEVMILFYAVNKIGAICNLVHPLTPYNQVAAIMDKTNTKLGFIFEQRIAKEVEKYIKTAFPKATIRLYMMIIGRNRATREQMICILLFCPLLVSTSLSFMVELL